MQALIIVRYGELSTKNKNKIDFINQLKTNIKNSLQAYPHLKYTAQHDHIAITNFHEQDKSEINRILSMVFGISNFSWGWKLAKDFNLVEKTIVNLINDQTKARTFKLIINRTDKKFPLTSQAMTEQLASIILQHTHYQVDVKNPDLNIYIQVKADGIYCFINKIAGARGLPVGSSGRVLLLLSGGIDSPVAAYQLMKRGVEVIYLHFTTPPVTDEKSIMKVKNLVTALKSYNNGSQNLYLCNFLPLQNELMHLSNASYRITLMRRMFIKIANQLAKANNILALATGDALGQVASQTLASINVINAASQLPILRPLITEDKVDIINLAQKIKTYELSILPFDDCCSLFVPKNPVTNPKLVIAEKLEAELAELINIDNLIHQLTIEIKKVTDFK